MKEKFEKFNWDTKVIEEINEMIKMLEECDLEELEINEEEANYYIEYLKKQKLMEENTPDEYQEYVDNKLEGRI